MAPLRVSEGKVYGGGCTYRRTFGPQIAVFALLRDSSAEETRIIFANPSCIVIFFFYSDTPTWLTLWIALALADGIVHGGVERVLPFVSSKKKRFFFLR